ncbi:hypothetical protein J6590_094375, partial [Homalodisca vitripennis]
MSAPCPTNESAECRCGLGLVTVRPHMSTLVKIQTPLISVTVRARCGHDGLVSVRTCLNLQVEYCAAIPTPYDSQQSVDSRCGYVCPGLKS